MADNSNNSNGNSTQLISQLNLSQKKLKQIPPEILSMGRVVQRLALNSNKLKELPPNFAEHFPALTSLNLSHNHFKKFPIPILLLENLQRLDISLNGIDSLPEDFGNCVYTLVFINVCNNRLKKLPRIMGRMPNLAMLRLSGNPLTYPPKGLLKNEKNKHATEEEFTAFLKNWLLSNPSSKTDTEVLRPLSPRRGMQALQEYQNGGIESDFHDDASEGRSWSASSAEHNEADDRRDDFDEDADVVSHNLDAHLQRAFDNVNINGDASTSKSKHSRSSSVPTSSHLATNNNNNKPASFRNPFNIFFRHRSNSATGKMNTPNNSTADESKPPPLNPIKGRQRSHSEATPRSSVRRPQRAVESLDSTDAANRLAQLTSTTNSRNSISHRPDSKPDSLLILAIPANKLNEGNAPSYSNSPPPDASSATPLSPDTDDLPTPQPHVPNKNVAIASAIDRLGLLPEYDSLPTSSKNRGGNSAARITFDDGDRRRQQVEAYRHAMSVEFLDASPTPTGTDDSPMDDQELQARKSRKRAKSTRSRKSTRHRKSQSSDMEQTSSSSMSPLTPDDPSNSSTLRSTRSRKSSSKDLDREKSLKRRSKSANDATIFSDNDTVHNSPVTPVALNSPQSSQRARRLLSNTSRFNSEEKRTSVVMTVNWERDAVTSDLLNSIAIPFSALRSSDSPEIITRFDPPPRIYRPLSMPNSPDMQVVKFVMVGNAGVGKSAFIYSLLHGKYPPLLLPGGGNINVTCIPIDLGGIEERNTVLLEFWELSGLPPNRQYQNGHLFPSMFEDVAGIIVAYDLTDIISAEDMAAWFQLCANYVSVSHLFALGMKNDLFPAQTAIAKNKMTVTSRRLAASYNADMTLCSATEPKVVREIIQRIVNKYLSDRFRTMKKGALSRSLDAMNLL